MEAERLTDCDRNNHVKSRGIPGLLAVMWVLGTIKWQPMVYHDFHEDGLTSERQNGKGLFLSLSSLLVPLTVTILSFSSALVYFTCFFGRADHFLRFLSYICCWLSTTSPQILCTIASLRHFRREIRIKGDISWVNVFNGNYFLNRFPNLNKKGALPKFAIFVFSLLFGLFVASVEVAYLVTMGKRCRYWSEYMWTISDVLNWPFFACFCYYLYLHRISLEERVNTTSVFISKNVGKLNDCINESRELFQNYLQLRKLLLPWLRIILFSSSFGMSLFFTWNYADLFHNGKNATATVPSVEDVFNFQLICDYPCHDIQFMKKNNILFFYNVMTLSRDMLILILPLIVVRGLNIEYIWERFKMRVYYMYSADEEQIFWKDLTHFVDKLHPNTTSDTIYSSLIPLLGLASGLLGLKRS